MNRLTSIALAGVLVAGASSPALSCAMRDMVMDKKATHVAETELKSEEAMSTFDPKHEPVFEDVEAAPEDTKKIEADSE
jgi:hypothetical protein